MTASNNTINAQEAKVFVLAAVALSAGLFNISFWYGVFGTVFFDHLFYVWVASTVAFLASLLVPPVDALPKFISWRGRIVLLLPTIWFLLEIAVNTSNVELAGEDWLCWGLTIAIVILTLPYLVYVLVLIAVPDIDHLHSPRLRSALIVIVLAVAISGFAIGKNHPVFLTCQDFKIAGDNIPDNCRNFPSNFVLPKN